MTYNESLRQAALVELATRELEKRFKPQSEDLLEFIKYFFQEEKGKEFKVNWHHKLIAEKLKEVVEGKCTRLIINIPPRSGKTELITKCFPVWLLGNHPEKKIIATGYSTSLTQTFSNEARDYYTSTTYRNVFPRRSELREDQNTKEWWVNQRGGSYFATGTGGSITGRGADIFVIDDPIKPDKADTSDIERVGINNWYENTVLSRLDEPTKGAIIIIMQRTHENDLCGHLIAKMEEGTGQKFEVLSIPAIAEVDDDYRKEGESIQEDRLPIEFLEDYKRSNPVIFSTQYQQNPIAKESQEFHEEWFRFYENAPLNGRIFTAVDPAFSKRSSADYTAIITAKFHEDYMYLLEVTHGRFDPGELEDKIVYHARKWSPEKIGVEAFAAQKVVGFSLRNRLRKEMIPCDVEDITQTGSKEAKIRRLIPLYRNGQIYHTRDMGEVEQQLIKFPRARHDDIIDTVQMLYDMYSLQPNVKTMYQVPEIKYDSMGRPLIINA